MDNAARAQALLAFLALVDIVGQEERFNRIADEIERILIG